MERREINCCNTVTLIPYNNSRKFVYRKLKTKYSLKFWSHGKNNNVKRVLEAPVRV